MERRTFAGGIRALVPAGLESAGFFAAFTERTGGVSRGRFASLNLALRAGDEPDRPPENRGRAIEALEMEPFACVRQVHGARIVHVGPAQRGSGYASPEDAAGDADGLVTDSLNVSLLVLAADCVPVVLADPSSGVLVVVHAGWRGTAAGILADAVRLFPDPRTVRGAVGPAVGIDHYEVGEEVVAAIADGTGVEPITSRAPTSVHLDLPGTVIRTLRHLGVGDVDHEEACTACEPDRFFSYRRDGRTGRQAVIAARLE